LVVVSVCPTLVVPVTAGIFVSTSPVAHRVIFGIDQETHQTAVLDGLLRLLGEQPS